MVDSTIEVYNKNADSFYEDTVNVDMAELYNRFLKYIKPSGTILDAGCGSGRDSLFFKNHGFHVTAFDASEEMVQRSSKLLGQPVYRMYLEEVNFRHQFDGIWACASMLHVKRTNLEEVTRKLAGLLTSEGVIYMSFKYGDKEYEKDGRYFNCYDETTYRNLVQSIPELKIKEIFITTDARPSRKGEYWLNIILHKI
jgi:SAM-dependent methyltransferase